MSLPNAQHFPAAPSSCPSPRPASARQPSSAPTPPALQSHSPCSAAGTSPAVPRRDPNLPNPLLEGALGRLTSFGTRRLESGWKEGQRRQCSGTSAPALQGASWGQSQGWCCCTGPAAHSGSQNGLMEHQHHPPRAGPVRAANTPAPKDRAGFSEPCPGDVPRGASPLPAELLLSSLAQPLSPLQPLWLRFSLPWPRQHSMCFSPSPLWTRQ